MKNLPARETGCRAAVPILIEMFHDPERQVRASAESALLQIDPGAATRAGLR
jgi:HEAT repeat protein